MNNDLISRSELLKRIYNYCQDYQGYEGLLDIITEMPIVEIPRGEWIEKRNINNCLQLYCNQCGAKAQVGFISYCGKCGAKMKQD